MPTQEVPGTNFRGTKSRNGHKREQTPVFSEWPLMDKKIYRHRSVQAAIATGTRAQNKIIK